MKSRNIKRLGEKLVNLELDRLHEVLDYNPETGVFMWRLRTGPTCKLDRPAGNTNASGYRRITLDGVIYPAHHLAWFHFYGVPAEEELDFINHDKTDIRIANLREATRSENSRYRKRSALNTTGLKGASRFYNRYNKAKYRAAIRVGEKRIFLGLFHTPEAAYEAYCEAAKKYYGKFAWTK
jgi:hypothetical protein